MPGDERTPGAPSPGLTAAVAVPPGGSLPERAAVAAIMRSYLPVALPAAAGLDMAARYVPRDGDVGGDWYDVFTVPSGELWAVMGDVAGAGLQAAIVMGRLRSAPRCS